ncbi:MAG: ABC transporter substrate-binding protein [Betaproteobacteria bacterium]|nr:ABC transporter substrate-binding protein [Betaproteobacteria bacterium]MBV9360484.1 ABC transporter substrate-binding protein [Betaproteobacteria bacterium]
MRRRQFLAGSAALAWPLVVRAQRSTPFIGFLNSGSSNERAHLVEAFRGGLKEGGYVDGKNVAIEYRWAESHPDLLPKLATELVDRKVAVIVATGSLAPALAAKSATKTIPIVFVGAEDPVKLGLVASLSHPRGNVTGVTGGGAALHRKRMEILKDVIPGATKIVYLGNPDNPDAKASAYDVLAAAEAMRMQVDIVNARTEAEIEAVFGAMKQMHASALLVATDPFFTSRRELIVQLAARYAIPASYSFREFPEVGGLMSYGPNVADVYRQAGIYAARVLNGAKPADLPVLQASRIELVVNLKAAKQLGLSFPRDFLARVDEVIQ